MTDRLPLPKPVIIDRHIPTNIVIRGYTADQMREYSDACNAALQKNYFDAAIAVGTAAQEIAALRAERDALLNDIHSCGPTCTRAGCVNGKLRADNIALQNNVVIPLRERVKVLEDALEGVVASIDGLADFGRGHIEHWIARDLRKARAALEATK